MHSTRIIQDNYRANAYKIKKWALPYNACATLISSCDELHRESKKQDTKLLAITSLTIIRFSKFFH